MIIRKYIYEEIIHNREEKAYRKGYNQALNDLVWKLNFFLDKENLSNSTILNIIEEMKHEL